MALLSHSESRPRTVIAIDPSLTATGVAVLGESKIVHAAFCRCSNDGSLAERISAMSDAVDAALLVHADLQPPGLVVIERPRVNTVTHGGKADPDDLIKLAILVGALAMRWKKAGFDVRMVQPAEWKGQVPKEITMQRVMSALSQEETKAVHLPFAQSLHHNVWDAVGIALWVANRY